MPGGPEGQSLPWKPAAYFYEGPDHDYFRLCGPKVSVTTAQLCCCGTEVTMDKI